MENHEHIISMETGKCTICGEVFWVIDDPKTYEDEES